MDKHSAATGILITTALIPRKHATYAATSASSVTTGSTAGPPSQDGSRLRDEAHLTENLLPAG